jgi:hypothetical protein
MTAGCWGRTARSCVASWMPTVGPTFPGSFCRLCTSLYELTLLARGGTGYEDAERDGWVVAALRPLGHAVELQRVAAGRPLNEQEAALSRMRPRPLTPGCPASRRSSRPQRSGRT